jgi:hypothetical protein
MKNVSSTLRQGELNEFDRGFQAEMDTLTRGAYDAFEK